MRRTLAALAASALAAHAAEPADLVAKLGAPRFADREAAGRELLRAGSASMPALQAAATGSIDAEVRTRSLALLEVLGRQSESAKVLQVKSVELDFRGQPLGAVVAKLKERTGIPLALARVADAGRPITLVGGPVAPWEAVAKLCDAAGLHEEFRAEFVPETKSTSNYQYRRYYDDNMPPHVNPGQVPVFLVDGAAGGLSGTRSAGVRVLALPGKFATNRVIRGSGRVDLTLDVTPLPHLNWTDVSAVRITHAEDETGRPVFADQKPLVDSAYYGTGWGGFWGQQMFWDDYGQVNTGKAQPNPRLVTVSLRTDDRSVKRLKRLEGVVVGEVGVQNVPVITIDNLAKARTEPFVGPNDLKLSISGVTATANGNTTCRVRIEAWQEHVLRMIKKNNGAANPLGRMVFFGGWYSNDGNLSNSLAFFDAAGRQVPTPGARSTSLSSDGFRTTTEMELEFPKSPKHGPPVKLIYLGTKPVAAEVPFACRDVELP
jgi:hypothetical protein